MIRENEILTKVFAFHLVPGAAQEPFLLSDRCTCHFHTQRPCYVRSRYTCAHLLVKRNVGDGLPLKWFATLDIRQDANSSLIVSCVPHRFQLYVVRMIGKNRATALIVSPAPSELPALFEHSQHPNSISSEETKYVLSFRGYTGSCIKATSHNICNGSNHVIVPFEAYHLCYIHHVHTGLLNDPCLHTSKSTLLHQ